MPQRSVVDPEAITPKSFAAQRSTWAWLLRNVQSGPFAIVANDHAPSLDFRRWRSYKLYELDSRVLFVRNFGVPSHVETEYRSVRPWASPGQPENSRSDLVESHLAGRRRASLESRRSRSEGPCPTVKASSPRSGSHPRWRCWRRCWLRRSGRRGSSPSRPGPIASAAISPYPRANHDPPQRSDGHRRRPAR